MGTQARDISWQLGDGDLDPVLVRNSVRADQRNSRC